jgi:hypothetical protein
MGMSALGMPMIRARNMCEVEQPGQLAVAGWRAIALLK